MSVGRLVVFGGTGFLGREVCRIGANLGWNVISISRKPRILPDYNVDYVEADVFHSSQYNKVLKDADAVVDCIGSFMADKSYKSLANGPFSPLAVGKLIRSRILGPNPLAVESLHQTNTGTAAAIARAAAENSSIVTGRLPFVYVSAEDWSQFAPPDYIESKRNAEREISLFREKLRPVYIRPGFMYEARSQIGCWPSVRGVLSRAIEVRDAWSDATPKGISVEAVASAIIDAVQDDEIEGVVTGMALKEFERMSST